MLSTIRAPIGSESPTRSGHCENAVELTSFSSESLPNPSLDNDKQRRKEKSPILTTLLGMSTAGTAESVNAYDSIPVNEQSDSKMISESEMQFEKHLDPRISTCFGIRIDLIDEE
jgi:hypothetical protein